MTNTKQRWQQLAGIPVDENSQKPNLSKIIKESLNRVLREKSEDDEEDLDLGDTEDLEGSEDMGGEDFDLEGGEGESMGDPVETIQAALTQALEAAQSLGDEKLTDQIGNTITFFTRAHVVKANNQGGGF